MKKLTRIVFVVLVTASFFTACHKSGGKLAKYIPKDAYMVFSINTKSIVGKAEKANMSMDTLIAMFEDNKDSAKKAMDKYNELKNSGIDFDQPALAFIKMGGSIMAGQSFSGGFVLALKSPGDFESYLKKEHTGKEIKKGDNYSYMATGDGFVTGWNDQVAIIAAKSGGTSSPGTYATGEGTLSQQMLTQLFAQKESESILSVKGYDEMAGKTADMAFFLSTENIPANPILSMSKFSDLLKGGYSVGTADFEDGKITMSFSSHAGEAMADLLKKYPTRDIDISMIDKYPGNIQGFMIGAFDPRLVPAFLQFAGFDAVANQYMLQAGVNLTLNDIFKAFKGDVAVVGGDLAIENKTITEANGYKFSQPITTNVPTFKLITNLTIDKAAYDKVASVLAEKGFLVQQNGQYVFPGMSGSGYVMNTTDKNLYIASSADALQQYVAGTGKNNLPGDVHDMLKGKSFAMYVDINSLLKAVPARTSPNDQQSLDNAKATFKYILVTGERTDSKASSGKADIVFMNDKENSLVTLLRYAKQESVLEKSRRMTMDMNMPMTDSTAVDTTAIPPPPPPKP